MPGEPGVDYPILASIQVPSAVLILIFMASTIISFSSWLPYNRPLFGRWCPITVSISRGPAITDQFEFNLSTSYPGDEFHLRRPCDGRLLCRSRAGLPGLPRLPSGPKLLSRELPTDFLQDADLNLYPVSFLCPNGTVFNQEIFVCDWW